MTSSGRGGEFDSRLLCAGLEHPLELLSVLVEDFRKRARQFPDRLLLLAPLGLLLRPPLALLLLYLTSRVSPRLFRFGIQNPEASINCTLPWRCAGLRLLNTHI